MNNITTEEIEIIRLIMKGGLKIRRQCRIITKVEIGRLKNTQRTH